MSLNLFKKLNNTYLNLIDWEPLIKHLVGLFQFDNTIQKVDKFFELKHQIVLEIEFNSIDFFYQDLNYFIERFKESTFHIQSNIDPFKLLERISKGEILSLIEVNQLCLLFNFFDRIFPQLKLWEKVSFFSIPELDKKELKNKFYNSFRNFVQEDGTIHYERHPKLRPIYSKIKSEEVLIKSKLNKLLKSNKFIPYLQFEEYDLINERFVIPIRSDSYNHQLGPIIGRSSTGKTLFIEPTEIKKHNNIRIEYLSLLENEIIKIIQTYCQQIQTYNGLFHTITNFLFELDFTIAKTLFCQNFNLSKPEVSSEKVIDIEELFHPLINEPIKNNIFINNSSLGLIISGPNTGGKTVTLKSLALCHILFKLGFYVPAKKATLYPFDGLFYFANDQQNLEKGLSSFSSEALNYLTLLEEVQENDSNLIFIDEIFNSTSSEEASSLAIGLLDEIHLKSYSKLIISTHHQLFKTFIHSNESYLSSHMGFNFENNTPNYKLHIGSPGNSMALKIFDNICKENNVHTSIMKTAQSLLDKKQITYENLLEKLSKEKNKLELLIQENKALKTELSNQKDSMKGLLFLEKEKELSRYKNKIKNILLKSETLLKKVQNKSFKNKNEIFNESHSIKGSLLQMENNKKTTNNSNYSNKSTPVNVSNLVIGHYYFSTLLNKKVKAISFNSKQKKCLISNNSIKMWVPLNTLLSQPASPSQKNIHIYVNKTSHAETTLDCRGMQLDQFQKDIENSISSLFDNEIPYLEIIHGHGEGILKNWLRSYLTKNFNDLEWKPLDGNDGITIITKLKKSR